MDCIWVKLKNFISVYIKMSFKQMVPLHYLKHSLVSRYFGGNYVCVDGELRKNHRQKLV